MAFLTWSLCLTVAVCAITAHIAVPAALFLAVSCITGAVFLGVVTAVVVVGVGVVAAVLFGFGTVAWTIVSSLLAPTTTTDEKVTPPKPAQLVAKDADDAVEGLQYNYEEPNSEDDCLLDRTAELRSFFSSAQSDGQADNEYAQRNYMRPYNANDPDDLNSNVTYAGVSLSHPGFSALTCPSSTCCSFPEDADEQHLLDLLSSACTSARHSSIAGSANPSTCGGSVLDSPLFFTATIAAAASTLQTIPSVTPGGDDDDDPAIQTASPDAAATPASPPPSESAPGGGGSSATPGDPDLSADHRHQSLRPPPAAADLAALALPGELCGGPPADEDLDVDVMSSCQFVSLLGKGSFGLVDLVRLELPDGVSQLAARKTLPHRDAHSYMTLRAMQAASGSPFAIRYLGSCEYLSDRLEVFMEFAQGGSLEQELEAALRAQQPTPSDSDAPQSSPPSPHQLLLPLQRIRVVAASVLLSLSELHGQGLAHLALEAPRHVLLGPTGRVLLGGLSSAAVLGSRNHLGRLCGPSCCTAPELMRRSKSGKPPRVVAASDLYSVGVLAGLCAFGFGERRRVAAREDKEGEGKEEQGGVLAWAPRWGAAGVGAGQVPEWVPEELRQFIVALMEEDPRQRPSLVEALGHPFLADLREEDVLL